MHFFKNIANFNTFYAVRVHQFMIYEHIHTRSSHRV